jgi:hypothetical protein
MLPRLACTGLLALLPIAGCGGWDSLRRIAAPTADFERVVRQPASTATFALERMKDEPVCYEYYGVNPSSPTCVDGLRANIDAALETLVSDFLSRKSPGAQPDYVASFKLLRVERTWPRFGDPRYEAEWGISIVDRCGTVIVRATRTTHGEPMKDDDFLGGLRELQVAVLREARSLLSESILAASGGAPPVGTCAQPRGG